MTETADAGAFVSGLYPGLVTHARLRPRPHRLRYRIFMLLLDLDELDRLDAGLKLFSLRRFNLTGFDPRRHGDGSKRPLKAQVEAQLSEAGLPTGGPVRMLTMPHILGSVFNPLTVYYCYAADGALSAIVYEVNNTFGERHSYLIPAPAAEGVPAGRVLRQSCEKQFYVSPFMDMDLSYAFRLRPPGDTVQVFIDVDDAEGPLLAAGFAGGRRALTDRNLLRAWLTHPWMTLGVLAAIHWEALFIWLKGERIRTRPPKPSRPVTVVTPPMAVLRERPEPA